MDRNAISTRSFVTGLLFFFGFIGYQLISHGKAETSDFLAASVLAILVGLGTWFIAQKRLEKK